MICKTDNKTRQMIDELMKTNHPRQKFVFGVGVGVELGTQWGCNVGHRGTILFVSYDCLREVLVISSVRFVRLF